LRAGILGAQVVHLRWLGTPPKLHTGTESNAAPFVLHPRVKKTEISAADPDPTKKGIRTAKVELEPAVGKAQRVVLFLNELAATAPRAFSAVALRRENDTDPVEFHLFGVDPGMEFLVRVQVDGAESPLELKDGAYAGPKVTAP
ncbi:MAG: DUF4255 domain-containing protein, partial [Thermoanaerobaculia bacterium]